MITSNNLINSINLKSLINILVLILKVEQSISINNKSR